jgi:hypothetical protein
MEASFLNSSLSIQEQDAVLWAAKVEIKIATLLQKIVAKSIQRCLKV